MIKDNTPHPSLDNCCNDSTPYAPPTWIVDRASRSQFQEQATDQHAIAVLHPRGSEGITCQVNFWKPTASPITYLQVRQNADNPIELERLLGSSLVFYRDGDMTMHKSHASLLTHFRLCDAQTEAERTATTTTHDDAGKLAAITIAARGIDIKIPISRSAVGVIGRRVELVDRYSQRAVADGVVGWR